MKALKNSGFFCFFTILIMTLCLFLGGQEAVVSTVQVPVIVNIYNNADTTAAKARAAVEEANKILKQAGMKLVVREVNENATGGDTGQDGDITEGETRGMIEHGKKELDNTPNKKGLKVSFTRTPLVGSTTPGWCVHNQPVVVIKTGYYSEYYSEYYSDPCP